MVNILDYKPPLATVEVVQAVLDFDADNLQVAMICDKSVIIERGELSPGDLCFYIRPGSKLPKANWTGMKKRHDRIKTIKFLSDQSYSTCFFQVIIIYFIIIQ